MTRKKSQQTFKKSKADSTDAKLFAPITSNTLNTLNTLNASKICKINEIEQIPLNNHQTLSCPPVRCLLRFCLANDRVNVCCNCKKPSSLMCPCVDINITEMNNYYQVTYVPTFFCIQCLPASKTKHNLNSDHETIHGILFVMPNTKYDHPTTSPSKLTKDDFVTIPSFDWKSKIVSLLSEKIWNSSTPYPPDYSCKFRVHHDDILKSSNLVSCGSSCRICFKTYKNSIAEICAKVQTVRSHYDFTLVRDMIKQPELVEAILNEHRLPYPFMRNDLVIFRFGLDILNKRSPDFVVVDLLITASGTVSYGSLLCSKECMECEANIIKSGAHTQVDCIVYDMLPYVLMNHMQSAFKNLSLSNHLRQNFTCALCQKNIIRRKHYPCTHCEFAIYCSPDHRFKHQQSHLAMCRSKLDQWIFLKNV